MQRVCGQRGDHGGALLRRAPVAVMCNPSWMTPISSTSLATSRLSSTTFERSKNLPRGKSITWHPVGWSRLWAGDDREVLVVAHEIKVRRFCTGYKFMVSCSTLSSRAASMAPYSEMVEASASSVRALPGGIASAGAELGRSAKCASSRRHAGRSRYCGCRGTAEYWTPAHGASSFLVIT